MPGKQHGPSIKDSGQYEALRREGMSKEKAARISNESAGSSRSKVGPAEAARTTTTSGRRSSSSAARGRWGSRVAPR